MAARHRSADRRWWSWRSWSIQRLRGRPELRTQSRSGRLPTDASTCSLSAWWAGMLGDILATKMASRRLLMLSITGRRPVRAATSSLRMWSCQRMRRICRWHFMWKASNVLTSAASSVHVSDAISLGNVYRSEIWSNAQVVSKWLHSDALWRSSVVVRISRPVMLVLY